MTVWVIILPFISLSDLQVCVHLSAHVSYAVWLHDIGHRVVRSQQLTDYKVIADRIASQKTTKIKLKLQNTLEPSFSFGEDIVPLPPQQYTCYSLFDCLTLKLVVRQLSIHLMDLHSKKLFDGKQK